MSLSKISEMFSLSPYELKLEIQKTEVELVKLRFKNSTRQTFKPHELKHKKRYLRQVKTLLTAKIRVEDRPPTGKSILTANYRIYGHKE